MKLADFAVMEAHSLASHLADEMIARNWKATDVASRMPGDYGINVGVINFLLVVQAEQVLITDGLVSDLSVAFGVSQTFIRNIHKQWLENPSQRVRFDCPEDLLDGLTFPTKH